MVNCLTKTRCTLFVVLKIKQSRRNLLQAFNPKRIETHTTVRAMLADYSKELLTRG
jgi:hypothetical protein